MKKLLIILILFGLLITNKVNASNVLPPVIGFLGWEVKYKCVDNKFPLSIQDYQNAGLIQFVGGDYGRANYNTLITEIEGYCLSDSIGAVYDLKRENALFNPQVTGLRFFYCEKGLLAGIDANNPSTYVETANYVYLDICCPSSHQFLYTAPGWEHLKCCSKLGYDSTYVKNNNRCSSSEIGIEPINLKEFWLNDEKEKDNSIYIKKAEQRYTCEVNNCFLINGSVAGASINRSNLTLKDINQNKYECFKNQAADIDIEDVGSNSYSSQYNSNMQFYCIAGDVLDKTEIEKYKNKLNPYVACKSYSSEEEQQKCIDCLNQCGEDDNSCVYSSLGCVRTSVDGVLTTVMRIGVGILGAVGIFRIMQAAILRQSADPKDIQESWDIIISVIIGAIVLLASTIILRIIGVDILGILPFDF